MWTAVMSKQLVAGMFQHHCSCSPDSPLIPVWKNSKLRSFLWTKNQLSKVEDKTVAMCVRTCVCLWGVLLEQLSCREKVRPRQGAFCLSAAAVSMFIELEFIIQPFFCVMSSRAGGREREREGKTQRGGPSNSTGVHTHWIVWSSWVARLFLAQSNSLALYWLHWWEKKGELLCTKGSEWALKATFGGLKPRGLCR